MTLLTFGLIYAFIGFLFMLVAYKYTSGLYDPTSDKHRAHLIELSGDDKKRKAFEQRVNEVNGSRQQKLVIFIGSFIAGVFWPIVLVYSVFSS